MQDSAKSNRSLFELDLLRALVMVADCGSFTTAATRLHSTQSTVSQKVRRLEELAGHRLLERGHRDVHPTDAGHTLLGYARRMLDLNEEMAQALAGAMVETAVRIGVPEDFVNPQTTRMLAAFSRRHPQVKLEISSGLSRDRRRASTTASWTWCWSSSAATAAGGALPARADALDRQPAQQLPAAGPAAAGHVSAARPVPRRDAPRRGSAGPALAHRLHQLIAQWHPGAVADGIGISLLPRRAVTREHRIIDGERGLPVVDNYEIGLLHRADADDAVRALASELWRQVRREPD